MPIHCPQIQRPFALLLALMALVCPRLAADPRTNWVLALPSFSPEAGPKSPPITALYSHQDRVLLASSADSIATSYDGELWGSAGGDLLSGSPALVTVGDTVLALDGNRSYTLENNRTWKLGPEPLKGSLHDWSVVAQGNNTYVAASSAGVGGIIIGGVTVYGLDYSTNLLTWSAASFFQYPGCAGLVFVQDHFLLLTPGGGTWHSADGHLWQPYPVDLAPVGAGEATDWLGLRQLNGVCVALGRILSSPNNGVIASSRDGGTTWNVQKPPGTTEFNDAAYADGRYVVVGAGVVGHSDDAEHWTFDTDLTPDRLVSVSHVAGRFVALSSLGISYTSADGIHWDSPQLGGYWLNAVSATPDGFVAVGSHGKILTSPNGTDWRPEVSGTTEDLYGVGTGGGLTLATGADGTILTSPDTHTWTLRHRQTNGTPYDLKGVAYARGRYVVAGAYLTSTNGLDWETTPGHGAATPTYASAILDDGQQFLYLSGPTANAPEAPIRVARSVDGLTWTFAQLAPNGSFGGSLAYTGGTYVAVGPGYTAVSTNGVNWQTHRYDINEIQLYSVTAAEGGFVAVGANGVIATSPDGVAWSPAGLHDLIPLNGIAYRDGVYVTVGGSGRVYFSLPQGGARFTQARWVRDVGLQMALTGVYGQRYRVQYTTDRQTWTDLTPESPTPYDSGDYYGIRRVIDPGASTNSFRLYRAVEQ